MSKIITENANQTKKIAREITDNIKPEKSQAVVICLTGNLGSGKTTFIQGFAKSLGVKERVISPTFVIMRIYKLKSRKFNHLIHIDAYRISKTKELIDLGWEEIVSDSRNIILIEWADKIKKILPKKNIQIDFEHKGKNKRWVKTKRN